MGQMGRNFSQRLGEHKRAVKIFIINYNIILKFDWSIASH